MAKNVNLNIYCTRVNIFKSFGRTRTLNSKSYVVVSRPPAGAAQHGRKRRMLEFSENLKMFSG